MTLSLGYFCGDYLLTKLLFFFFFLKQTYIPNDIYYHWAS